MYCTCVLYLYVTLSHYLHIHASDLLKFSADLIKCYLQICSFTYASRLIKLEICCASRLPSKQATQQMLL